MTSVLVPGGTGTLGRLLVSQLAEAGNDIAVLSRRRPPAGVGGSRGAGGNRGGAVAVDHRTADLATGAGLACALAGVGTVVHLASDPRRPAAVDVAGTERLTVAAAEAGVRHLVLISIVGCDVVPTSYYRAKVRAERLVLAGPVPGSVLRAIQFHEFVPTLAETLWRGRFAVLPTGMRAQFAQDSSDPGCGGHIASPSRRREPDPRRPRRRGKNIPGLARPGTVVVTT
jgi:uncharacterized protein YbjT (DUF2867 family)